MPQLTPFQQSALQYKKHISLTANAGSGKTFVLANRYVEIAVNENIPLSKIVAITFTEKAAAELNKKISDEIDRRLNEETNSNKLKILQRIRRQLTSANISTIHSFCISILKEFSPEVGIDANFTPLNQQDANEMLDITIEEFVSQNLQQTNYTESLKKIIRLLGGKYKFISEIKNIVHNRKIFEKLEQTIYINRNEEIIQYYERLIDEFLHHIYTNELQYLIELIKEFNNSILAQDRDNQLAIEITYCIDKIHNRNTILEKIKLFPELVDLFFTKQFSVKKRGYQKKDYNTDQTLVDRIEEKLDELKFLVEFQIDKQVLQATIEYAKDIFQIGKILLEEYDERKRKAGSLDFEDILLLTKNLTSKRNFNELLKDKYEYIMIDEYQDTNEIQYEIFMPILNNLKKGNLFIVGDEKQSIYMFREAELAVFNRTKNEIVNQNESGNLILPHSFRVAPEIAHFVNELFSRLFADSNDIYNEVSYNELICSRNINEKGTVELLINQEDKAEESKFIASKIVEIVSAQETKSWSEFAVLCRKRDAFYELEKTFNEIGIPYVIAGGKGFYQRQIIYDLFNYISFLVNPDDDTALIGILRSPFYSLDDEIIYKIFLQQGENYFDKLKSSQSISAEIKSIVKKLERHILLASSIRLSALIRELFVSCNYWGVAAAKQNYEQEISNLFKLIGVARSFSTQRFKTLYDFKLYLNESILIKEDEGQAQVAEASNAVKIMTLHQSKGLEFKHVFLFKCNEKVRDESIKSKSIAINKTWGILTKVPRNKSYFSNYVSSAIIDLHNYIETKKQIAEAKRLFYVGITRAIDNVYITATVNDNKITKNSFLSFLTNALDIDLNSETVTLNSQLQFMADASQKFAITSHKFSTLIKIQKTINENSQIVNEKKKANEYKNYKLQQIADHEKNEIVSATKIAIFTQCPTKYYLTYELGYTELFTLTKSAINEYEFKYDEDSEFNLFADIKGQIIHKILEEENDQQELITKIEELTANYHNRIENKKSDFIKTVHKEVEDFYASQTFRRLKTYKNFTNEYEIYSKESDYYVYGIIDKLIIDGDSIIIVDYKTDNLSVDKINSKAEHYLPQLKFYAYVVSKLYTEITNFEVELIFIKHADHSVKFSFNRIDVEKFGVEIHLIVTLIRNQKFTKNLNHCAKCHFAVNQKCIFQT
ncbi:MAG: UvrD-helicase domain-containing protein [Melioribacteraceae bacterium]|nr:UvrD-helicase domain-containing protein [Melioribacteraceae bacterium]